MSMFLRLGGRQRLIFLRSAAGMLALVAALLPHRAAVADSYPDRPIRVLNQAASGNTLDIITRIVSDRLSAKLGQQLVVLNRPGAGGLVATREAASAPPDGYTIYMAASSAMIVLPFNQDNLRVDVNQDFIPVGLVAELPLVIAVRPNLGVNTLGELLDLARRRPGSIDYAGNTAGTLPHMTGLRLGEVAKVDLTFVPYQGGAMQAVSDMLGDRLSMIIEGIPPLAGALSAGTIKPLAVLSNQRLPSFPDLPTASETLPSFSSTGWLAIMAPKGTPTPIVERLSSVLREVLDEGDIKARLETIGSYPRFLKPQDLELYIRAEQQLWEPIVRRAKR